MPSFLLVPGVFGNVATGILAMVSLNPDADLARVKLPAASPQMCALPPRASNIMLTSLTTEPSPSPIMSGRRIKRAADGLFYVDATINGASIRLLVDTGATTIVLTQADAARAGVLLTKDSFDATANTAGGKTAMARVRLAQVAVNGSLDWNVPAAVAGEALGVSLLGASWLTQIGSVTITGDQMVLQ